MRAEIAIVLVVIALVGVSLYIANKRYHIRPEQLTEGSLYLVCLSAALWIVLRDFWIYQAKLEKTWPRVPAYIAPHKDSINVHNAFQQNVIVLGYHPIRSFGDLLS